MSGNKRITVLLTGLFPDQQPLEQALKILAEDHDMARHALHDQAMDDAAWDRVVDDILSSAKVVTV